MNQRSDILTRIAIALIVLAIFTFINYQFFFSNYLDRDGLTIYMTPLILPMMLCIIYPKKEHRNLLFIALSIPAIVVTAMATRFPDTGGLVLIPYTLVLFVIFLILGRFLK
jgi:hypothetical protein